MLNVAEMMTNRHALHIAMCQSEATTLLAILTGALRLVLLLPCWAAAGVPLHACTRGRNATAKPPARAGVPFRLEWTICLRDLCRGPHLAATHGEHALHVRPCGQMDNASMHNKILASKCKPRTRSDSSVDSRANKRALLYLRALLAARRRRSAA